MSEIRWREMNPVAIKALAKAAKAIEDISEIKNLKIETTLNSGHISFEIEGEKFLLKISETY